MTSRYSSGSRRDESAVEPTRSQNITVRCRRSPLASDGESHDAIVSEKPEIAAPSSVIVSSNRLRCSIGTTPISLRSSDVRLGNILASISLARNAGSYCSSPRLRSHAARSTLASRRGRRNVNLSSLNLSRRAKAPRGLSPTTVTWRLAPYATQRAQPANMIIPVTPSAPVHSQSKLIQPRRRNPTPIQS